MSLQSAPGAGRFRSRRDSPATLLVAALHRATTRGFRPGQHPTRRKPEPATRERPVLAAERHDVVQLLDKVGVEYPRSSGAVAHEESARGNRRIDEHLD